MSGLFSSGNSNPGVSAGRASSIVAASQPGKPKATGHNVPPHLRRRKGWLGASSILDGGGDGSDGGAGAAAGDAASAGADGGGVSI